MVLKKILSLLCAFSVISSQVSFRDFLQSQEKGAYLAATSLLAQKPILLPEDNEKNSNSFSKGRRTVLKGLGFVFSLIVLPPPPGFLNVLAQTSSLPQGPLSPQEQAQIIKLLLGLLKIPKEIRNKASIQFLVEKEWANKNSTEIENMLKGHFPSVDEWTRIFLRDWLPTLSETDWQSLKTYLEKGRFSPSWSDDSLTNLILAHIQKLTASGKVDYVTFLLDLSGSWLIDFNGNRNLYQKIVSKQNRNVPFVAI
ncbi:hypothetical protein HY612_00460 [Candidatus Roizmanbacteria bacterium]|nr:hypothetical protein [Candidatus Roizmanbacteria bacterium]